LFTQLELEIVLAKSQAPMNASVGEIRMNQLREVDGESGQKSATRAKNQLKGSLGSETPLRYWTDWLEVFDQIESRLLPSGISRSA
jgi:hypothetical protein